MMTLGPILTICRVPSLCGSAVLIHALMKPEAGGQDAFQAHFSSAVLHQCAVHRKTPGEFFLIVGMNPVNKSEFIVQKG